jgi:hypothetical protein
MTSFGASFGLREANSTSEAERMRAGGHARDRLDRAARAIHGDVDALVAENPALRAEKERRVAAIDAEFQAESHRLCPLSPRHMRRHDEQRCPCEQDVTPRGPGQFGRHDASLSVLSILDAG